MVDQLGLAFAARRTEGAATGAPGINGGFVLNALRFSFFFRQPGPGDFRIGVSDRRNHPRIKDPFVTCDNVGCHMPLMARLMGQHGLSHDIADGKDMRHIGLLSIADGNKAALIDLHPRLVGADQFAIGRAADGHQHSIKLARFRRGIGAGKTDF